MTREVEIETEAQTEKRFERWAEKSPRFEQWRKDIEQRAVDAITGNEKVWTLTGFREGGATLFPNEHPLEFRAVTLLWEHSGGKKYEDRVATTLYRPSSPPLREWQESIQASYSSRLYRIARFAPKGAARSARADRPNRDEVRRHYVFSRARAVHTLSYGFSREKFNYYEIPAVA